MCNRSILLLLAALSALLPRVVVSLGGFEDHVLWEVRAVWELSRLFWF